MHSQWIGLWNFSMCAISDVGFWDEDELCSVRSGNNSVLSIQILILCLWISLKWR